MSFPNIIHGTELEIFNSYTTEKVPVGAKMTIEDGRIFRFAECGAAALVIGNLNTGEAPSANFQAETIATLAAGVTTLTGIGATTASMSASALKQGYIYTHNATTLPLMKIRDNTLITLSASTGIIYLWTKTPTAIAAANTVSYFKNPWRDVIIHGTPGAAVYTGVCQIALAANSFGWLQTGGPCNVLYDADTTAIAAVNDPVAGSVSGDSDGSVSGFAAGDAETDPVVGWQIGMVEANAEQNTVWLRIDR
jgi:hypothetical protein